MPRPERSYHKRNSPVHGLQERKHPLYATWALMLTRCYDEIDKAFPNYGGRGITVCDRWLRFKNFAEDMGFRPYLKATLDRVDNDLGYFPENCTWSDRSEQNINRRKFKNNTTGVKGVILKNDRFEARIDWRGVRYRLGVFGDIGSARLARLKAEESIANGALPVAASDTVWCTSATKIRGVTETGDGAYMVRKTVNGERMYVGCFKSIEEAVDARNK